MALSLGPRVVVGATSSGAGKTTVATGLMAALRRRGVTVAGAKVGPDFIDPGYHALATGRPGRNLDSWICGEDAVAPLAGRAAAGADVLVVEGVMGLFDGSAGGGPDASTASVAGLLSAPVLLVVDASAMSRSVAAVVHGFATFDPAVDVAGVVLNRVGSPGHVELLVDALRPLGVPVLGALPRDDGLVWRDRHLGLVPVAEDRPHIAASLQRLADAVERSLDVDGIMALAARAPSVRVEEPPAVEGRPGAGAVIAVAGGPAFSFVYRDNLEVLEAAGAQLVPFDPLSDERLPEGVNGLYLGGGFPEVYAEALAGNAGLLGDVREAVGRGVVTWAECGGMLWLARELDGHRLAGVVGGRATMTGRLTLGYRTATTRLDTPLGPAGTVLRGHEFHYSALEPAGDAMDMEGRFGAGRAGHASAALMASYLHVHLGGDPTPGVRFAAACAGAGAGPARR